MSASSVLRILAEHPVRPWQYQSWIYPRDPDFEARAKVIVDLYQGFYQGEPLGPGDRILSFDAKPQINARRRLHPTLPAAPGRPVRYEHEYRRQGSLALLAGLDVHTGQVFASTPLTTGIRPFMDLAGQVMARPEYKNAPRVFVIVDNGSDHRGQAAISRLARAHPNAIMIHTPVHASWLNQIEIFFSVIQKKVVTPNDFDSLGQLSRTLLGFVDRYNQTARPFSWKFTASDLHDLMDRISRHEQQAQPSGRTATGGRMTTPRRTSGATHLSGWPRKFVGVRFGFVSESCEVDGAGGVECFLRAADGQPGEQDGVFVTVAGGGVDREAEGVGGAAVAEPEQRDLLAVAEHAGDVGEAAVVSGPDFGQLRPVAARRDPAAAR